MRWPNGEVIQQWQGWVAEIGDDAFWARLVDVTAGATEADEIAEIPIANLKPREREFLRVGAYLTIRVRQNPDGADIRFSRRRWTQRKLDRAARHAARLAKQIQWDAAPPRRAGDA